MTMKIKIKMIISIILISLIVLIFKIEIPEININKSFRGINFQVKEEYSKDEILFILNEIYNSDFKINFLSIKREENMFSLSNNFSFDYKVAKPSFDYNVYNKFEENIFKDFDLLDENTFGLENIWKIRDELEIYDQNIRFAGMIVENDFKFGYFYYIDDLIKIKVGDIFGQVEVVGIFKDGILLKNINNTYMVII